MNPYFCYAFSFTIAILTYFLGWSRIYPPLSFLLIGFLSLTIVAHTYFGLRFQHLTSRKYNDLLLDSTTPPIVITLLLYLLWTCEFLYEGGIPLVKILLAQPYNYRLFGIPGLHVLIVTFSSFYTIYLFHLYLSRRNKIILILFLLNLFAAILIYSRAMFFFNLTSCALLFISTATKIPKAVYIAAPPVVLLLLFVFGVLGTLRVSRESGEDYDNKLFLKIGAATDLFNNTIIPKEYFWTYIYVTSPLANLQHNINTNSEYAPTVKNMIQMTNNEILFDFISKRVNKAAGITRKGEKTIQGPFNVSTVYSRCFSYSGWTGIIVMAFVVLLIPWCYIKLIPIESPFFPASCAILSTMYLFLAYDNTIRFTGLSFQLVYPILLHHAALKSKWLRDIFVNNKVTTARS